jgi:hypothetical protein
MFSPRVRASLVTALTAPIKWIETRGKEKAPKWENVSKSRRLAIEATIQL